MTRPKCILLDIEGTTSSISFVHDVMFPWVRTHLTAFLQRNWTTPAVADCLPLLAAELGHASVGSWLERDRSRAIAQVEGGVLKMMDQDIKASGLKQLQGEIWQSGFESGQLVAHVYDDVAPSIRAWKAAGSDIRIYSSGSVHAQRLFFGHTIAGNLLPLFSGHYDTTIGSKKRAESYRCIADDAGFEPSEIVFISDLAAELDAAREAGMLTVLSVRPGNPNSENQLQHRSISRFDELEFDVCGANAN